MLLNTNTTAVKPLLIAAELQNSAAEATEELQVNECEQTKMQQKHKRKLNCSQNAAKLVQHSANTLVNFS